MMNHYEVMLEGIEGESPYLVTLVARAKSPEQAVELAISESSRRGLHITAVEEVERANKSDDPKATPAILEVLGRTFFSEED